ncbi:ester cyclase [Nocardioides panzhihuensis]|uniref:Putative ester cyclase n=1 Tax=Nocardioides panzhihuensis TaxID=860243 RepID=A0A7Z0DNK5_9ACTN|nr:ester cyclase [Nocardioides panzhihuensis]NYI78910.1 putative ester cyclase [Nocardioides panzhihuensis]
MSSHEEDKQLVTRMLHALAAAAPGASRAVLAEHCHPEATFEVFHPFNTLNGVDEAAEGFFEPLRASFPDYEQRIGIAIADTYEGRDVVSTLGHVLGTLAAPWCGIPATHGLTYLRFGTNAVVVDGRIAKLYILLDVVDVMRQAGYYPFRQMPGSAEQWPLPPIDTGATGATVDNVRGATTMLIVREMQDGLGDGEDLAEHVATVEHSPHWHCNMNWYGPAGIGSTRGQRGFDDYHGALFIQAFPDRTGFERVEGGAEDAPGHYIQAGDGLFGVTGGWPSLHGHHTGGQWLGLPPTGRRIEMRVADWYRLDDQNKIIDNWVMIDTLHIAQQMGYDVLDDLTYLVDRAKPRWVV